MGVILDTSILGADERGNFDMPGFLLANCTDEPAIAAITASELLHGVRRASDEGRRKKRSQFVENTLRSISIVPFDLSVARVHAEIWANLAAQGKLIGPHDLLVAATGVALGFKVATLNIEEFRRVPGLNISDATPFLKR